MKTRATASSPLTLLEHDEVGLLDGTNLIQLSISWGFRNRGHDSMSLPADNISIAQCFQFVVPGGDNEKSCWQHFACPYCHHRVEFTVLSGYIQRRLIISMESKRNFNCFSHQTENSKFQPADKDASLVSIGIILSWETWRISLIYRFHISAVVNTRLRLIRFNWGWIRLEMIQ